MRPEEELDLFIDSLNCEKRPGEVGSREAAELLPVVRCVKKLRPPAEPGRNFARRIYSVVAPGHSHRRASWTVATALVAALALFAIVTTWGGESKIVFAMGRAVSRLSSYHGTFTVRMANDAGETQVIRQGEIWWEGEKYARRDQDGTLTVNNGDRRWQVRPQEKEVSLLPLLPDPARNGLDLRLEAQRAKQYPSKVLGEETVAGRRALRLEITPPGGLPYHLWIDAETDLPLQMQTAVQNSLQTTWTFTSFVPNSKINPAVFTYDVPAGYRTVEKGAGQLVNTAEEAFTVSGFTPLLPAQAPARLLAFPSRVVLDYGDTTVTEITASGEFAPANYGAIGSAGGSPLEVTGERLRWRQGALEILVEGSQRVALAQQLAGRVELPDPGASLAGGAKVHVPVDLEIARADQQQVDGGHGPWQLDPLQVSLTFVNLQVTPEGIQGEPSIPFSSFSLTANSGVEAVVQVSSGPVRKVYLKRLVRQDESGIWSVVGYDPR